MKKESANNLEKRITAIEARNKKVEEIKASLAALKAKESQKLEASEGVEQTNGRETGS